MRDKPDHYTLQARKEGYPARSVYKLMEIQQKFRVIPLSGKVLDIGAAPGSWSLYVSKILKKGSLLVSVDLKPLSPAVEIDNMVFFQTDAFSPEFIAEAEKQGPFDAVISDAAPATMGNRTVDTGRSFTLAYKVIETAGKLLSPGGNLIVKVFQGGDEQELLSIVKKEYKTAKIFKPKSSRKESFEIFIIGTGKR